MKTEELLEKHPKTTAKLKEWWEKKIKEALDSEELSEEYKAIATAVRVQDKQIIRTIDNIPHTLFEFFDENEIFIREDFVQEGSFFGCSINEKITYFKFRNRKDAERDILDDAFPMLEDIL